MKSEGLEPIKGRFLIHNFILKQVNHFKYLGNIFSYTNKFDINYKLTILSK